jgi:hypothetical protein
VFSIIWGTGIFNTHDVSKFGFTLMVFVSLNFIKINLIHIILPFTFSDLLTLQLISTDKCVRSPSMGLLNINLSSCGNMFMFLIRRISSIRIKMNDKFIIEYKDISDAFANCFKSLLTHFVSVKLLILPPHTFSPTARLSATKFNWATKCQRPIMFL